MDRGPEPDAEASADDVDDVNDDETTDERILNATLELLASEGIAGVTMRAVARRAGVSVGLANYHFENKTELIAATLRRIGATDLELVVPAATGDPAEDLRHSLRQALDPTLLSPDYLSLRLQLWSLAGVDPLFAEINRTAQREYLAGLATLLRSARPDLADDAIQRRAADILTVQNGVWLTAILIEDLEAVQRARTRTESIAFE